MIDEAMADASRKPVRVAEANLGKLASEVQVPRYSRRNHTVSLVHIGVGGFHRAHQAVYLDDLLNQGKRIGWNAASAFCRKTPE